MHFIEQIFGLSPDGGSGLTEFLLLLIPLAALSLAAIRWRRQTQTRNGR